VAIWIGGVLSWFGLVAFVWLSLLCMSNQEHKPQCNQYSQYQYMAKLLACILFVSFLFAFVMFQTKKDL